MKKICKKVWRLKYFIYHCNPKRKEWVTCRSSSVGRAQPCQGWGREFEPRLLLQKNESAAMLTFVLKKSHPDWNSPNDSRTFTRRGSIICQSSLCTRSAFFFVRTQTPSDTALDHPHHWLPRRSRACGQHKWTRDS